MARDQRMDELNKAMSENYRKLGDLRRAAQESPEIKQWQASMEADRRALDEMMLSDPAVKALTDRRKALLDEMTALQARQSDLARRTRANRADMALKAEAQASLAKMRQTSSELGAIGRQVEQAQRNYKAQNAAAAELAARLAETEASMRKALTEDPEIQAIEQEITKLSAESRQLRQRQRRSAVPPAQPRPPPAVSPAGSESAEPSVEKNAP